MRHIYCIIFAFSFGMIFSQEKAYNQNIKLSILPELFDFNTNESYFLMGLSPGITYERHVTYFFNPFITVKYNGPVTIDFANGETSENIPTAGFGVTIGNKLFFGQNLFSKGFYVAPALSYSVCKFKESEDNPSLFLQFKDFVVKERFGYQWTTSHRFSWEVYTGVGMLFRNYYDNTLSESNTVININRIGIKPEIGFSFGYAL